METTALIGVALCICVNILALVSTVIHVDRRISKLEWQMQALWEAAGSPMPGDFPFRKIKD